MRFELHHDKAIKDNGAVYDIDNIRLTTPILHIEVYKGESKMSKNSISEYTET
ncbi:hypothetical protein [Type-D symbiont of Plautia stali]|uniref:hypothetical protein n=1 Tax=Type-D symbiont of Plautia stali TaxID=1560356 RepID=UPI003F706F2D